MGMDLRGEVGKRILKNYIFYSKKVSGLEKRATQSHTKRSNENPSPGLWLSSKVRGLNCLLAVSEASADTDLAVFRPLATLMSALRKSGEGNQFHYIFWLDSVWSSSVC